MQAVHSQWLDRGGADAITQSVTTTMNNAFGTSPFEEMIDWAVDSTFGTPKQTLWEAFEVNKSLNPKELLLTVAERLTLSGVKQNMLTALSDILDDDLVTTTLPRLQAGMRDINAIQTSSFIFAQGYIEASKTKQLVKASADIDFKMLEMSQQIVSTTVDWNKTLVVHSTEIGRLYLAAHLDELKFNVESMGKQKLWDLRVWEYGAHVMSSISGGTAPTGGEESSTVQNVLGGAMSGAAAGAQVGNMIGGYGGAGALIGGVAGGLGGYFS
jgi:hypothetical protein